MAKETFYFSHDYTARNDDKILELRSKFGAEGYGIFWMIIETMAQNDNGGVKAGLMGGLSLGYGIAKKTLEELFDYCVEIGLFYKNDGYFFSKRLLSHKDFRKKLSESGQKGAEMRKKWGGYKGGHSTPYAKERKGKEIIKGVCFEEDTVLMTDGTKQELGESQKLRVELNDLKPEEILKGEIF